MLRRGLPTRLRVHAGRGFWRRSVASEEACVHVLRTPCCVAQVKPHENTTPWTAARVRITPWPRMCAPIRVPPQSRRRAGHAGAPVGHAPGSGLPARRGGSPAPAWLWTSAHFAHRSHSRPRRITCPCHTRSPTMPPHEGSAGRAAQRQKASSRAHEECSAAMLRSPCSRTGGTGAALPSQSTARGHARTGA